MLHLRTNLMEDTSYAQIFLLPHDGLAQAVSRRLLTVTARVLSQMRLCGICGGQNGTATSFL
jgi:hypothetical protein